ncbi:BLUF domain-containing protein [Stenotrophomonas maltophilia]|uniref:BLUF domain-containing protein n=1 Tax=Stenotrophomonas maltophilia TaxID=40324 RepID=UPI0015DC2A93|nr:BLUF domain-containing protein [Stenotrophomonas maltophilia]QDL29617.1 BLUF domain-containing protein [Stenotrophomonas maltophilia]
MPNRAVVFVSVVAPHLDAEHLAAIMADAARFNRSAGVSGVTLYDGRRFLAYMEGPPDGLDVAFSRAAGASSHAELMELARGRVGQRRLPYWPMRVLPVSPDELLQLIRADWTSFVQRTVGEYPPVTAMEMLVTLVQPFAEAA